jgi:hypothetical protein
MGLIPPPPPSRPGDARPPTPPEPLNPGSALLELLLAALLLIGLAATTRGQDALEPPCDPAATPCLGTQGWLLTERSWTPGGAQPRDLAGARLQSEVRWRRWRWAARGDATGIPGEYRQGDWQTVRSLEVHVASAYDALHLPAQVILGPAIAVGAAVALEHDAQGVAPDLPKSVTAGIGFRASWPGGWIYGVAGQNQALRGVAGTFVWQIDVNDRVANIGSLAVGPGAYTGTFGVAVRLTK